MSTLGFLTLTVLSFLVYGRPGAHYTFILPDGYIGWIQIIFNDPGAAPLQVRKDRGHQIDVPETGLVRTSDLHHIDDRTLDEFYYRATKAGGTSTLTRVPPEYVIAKEGHGGWTVADTGGKGPGYSWFLFIGPPELRARTPMADITKEPGYGKKMMAPDVYPTPGRLKQGTEKLQPTPSVSD